MIELSEKSVKDLEEIWNNLILSRNDCKNIFLGGQISQDQNRTAVYNYAHSIENDELIILLYDGSATNSAKAGFLLTQKNLYFKNPTFSKFANMIQNVKIDDILDMSITENLGIVANSFMSIRTSKEIKEIHQSYNFTGSLFILKGFIEYIKREGNILATGTTSTDADPSNTEYLGNNPCPNCGVELEPEEKFCGGCGMAISAEQSDTPKEPPSDSSVNTETPGKPCINCAKALDPDWAVCPYCKAEVADGPPSCTACGKELEPDWAVCPYCKAEVTSGPPSCAACGKELDPEWAVCPYCKTEV